MELSEAIAIRLQNILDGKNKNQYSIQKEGGVPRSTVGKILGAKRKYTSVLSIYQITQTLGMSLKEFFDDPLFDDIID